MKKRIIAIIIVLALCISAFCSSASATYKAGASLSILTTLRV